MVEVILKDIRRYRYLYLSPGGKNAVDEVEGGEDNHHEKHRVDGNIPVEIPAQKLAQVTILSLYNFLPL